GLRGRMARRARGAASARARRYEARRARPGLDVRRARGGRFAGVDVPEDPDARRTDRRPAPWARRRAGGVLRTRVARRRPGQRGVRGGLLTSSSTSRWYQSSGACLPAAIISTATSTIKPADGSGPVYLLTASLMAPLPCLRPVP